MKKLWLAAVLFLIFIAGVKFLGIESSRAQTFSAKSTPIVFEVDEDVIISSPRRVGVNLGRWTSWGSQQYSRNVLKNPGFESQIDRIIVIVSQVDEESFSDEAGWGYSDGYWNEAEYDIRTGKSVGKRGIIRKSLNSGENGFPQYFSSGPLPPIEENDIIVITKISRPDPVNHWWVNDESVVQLDPFQSRPESLGSQSIRLSPTRTTHAELGFFLDAIAERAGKMLPVNGPWRFSLWVKAESPGVDLDISFQRMNKTPPFLREVIYPTTDWQEYHFDFVGKDLGPSEQLMLSIIATNPESSIWIDDVWLGPEQETKSSFREEVISVLQRIKPSYIREQAHLGDTWRNRVAGPFERKTWMYHLAGGRAEAVYSYSLPDLLELCTLVGANPWIIIPPTFSDYELKQLGSYLSKEATKERFSEVILEFGNENWNWLYRPAAIPYHQEHGLIAKRAFELISSTEGGKTNIRYFVNGQYSIPKDSLQFFDSTSNADGLAIAPYFFHSLKKGTPDEEALNFLFKNDPGLLQEISDEIYVRDKALAVYEINLHTTKGDAKAYERDRIVAGAASGSALAKKILECMFAGADPIMVYSLAQHDSTTWEIDGFVKLWGIVRDFGPPSLFRPTGLAVTMLNDIVKGDMHRILPAKLPPFDAEKLTMAAFRSSNQWTVAVVSENNVPQEIEIHFPDDGNAIPKTMQILDTKSPFDTNEDKENVTVKRKELEIEGRLVRFVVPPWGFVTLGG
ncbi:MAG: hypothetical protein K940chlam7_00456 [Chlamydiae bacterium]|nr:hypothetical protein [Chlamydiota bacterium]